MRSVFTSGVYSLQSSHCAIMGVRWLKHAASLDPTIARSFDHLHADLQGHGIAVYTEWFASYLKIGRLP